MKYHLSEDGVARVCKAENGGCPYKDAEHFSTQKAARKYFEKTQQSFASIGRTLSHKMKLSSDSEKLIDDLYEMGFTPYVVGGSVRDSMLSGEIPKDVDIEVFGVSDMDALEKSLKKGRYPVDSVGKSFGVLKTKLKNGDDIDISMPRKDSKIFDGHKGFDVEVDPNLTLAEAAGRRDFTINSLYYSREKEEIIDPYGGVADYKNGVLRHINDHFGEDPLRVLRGVQFASRFKMKLHEDTAEKSRDLLSEFDSISSERFQTEFEKMFTKGDVTWGLEALRETGWDKKFGLGNVNPSWGNRVQESISRAKELNEDTAVFGASKLLAAMPSAEHNAVNAFLTGEKRQKKALDLIQLQDPSELTPKGVNAWTRQVWRSKKLSAKDHFIKSGNNEVREIAEKLGIFDKPKEDFINGEMILKLGDRKPGPWVGNALQRANAAQDNALFTDKEGAERWLKKWGKELFAEASDRPQKLIVK